MRPVWNGEEVPAISKTPRITLLTVRAATPELYRLSVNLFGRGMAGIINSQKAGSAPINNGHRNKKVMNGERTLWEN